jgi:hypothetical protein
LILGLPAPTRGAVGVAAAIAGLALGFSVARHLERPKPVIIHAAAPVAPAPPPAAAPAYATAVNAPPVQLEKAEAVRADDLASAVAKGLGGKK